MDSWSRTPRLQPACPRLATPFVGNFCLFVHLWCHYNQLVVPWQEIRRAILDDFAPAALDQLPGPAVTTAQRMWRELKAVESINAWRSTSALSGQLLELLLKQSLIDRGEPTSIARKPLGPVLARALERNLFKSPTEALTVTNSVYAAKELRNIASHGSPWQEEDSEQRATYSLVFLVCFSGFLFPRLQYASGDQLDEGDDGSVLGELDDLRPDSPAMRGIENEQLDEFYIHKRLRAATPRAVLRLAARVTRDQPDLMPIVCSSIRQNFAYIIENAGLGRVRSVLDLARFCQDRRLVAQSRCCGILLPHDAEALRWLSSQSPLRFAKYLYECRRAEPRMFDRSFGGAGVETVRDIIVDWLARPDVNVTNPFSMMKQIPTTTLTALLNGHADAIIQRLRSSSVLDGVAVLPPLVRSRVGSLLTNSIPAALADRLKIEDLAVSAVAPLRLSQLGVIDHDYANGLIRHLLLLAGGEGALLLRQRILWDLYAMSVRYQAETVRIACKLLHSQPKDTGLWELLLLASVPIAAGVAVSIEPEQRDRVSELKWPQGERDRFQQLRVGLVLAKIDASLPKRRWQALRALAHSTIIVRQGERYAGSEDFLQQCRTAFE